MWCFFCLLCATDRPPHGLRERRHVGLLVVQVVGARDLKKMDAFGKADPFVELSTQPTHTVKTVRPETLTP